MSSHPPASLTVLALGSSHGDDRAAWHVAELLARSPEFSGQCVSLASPWDVTPYLAAGGAIAIVDACDSGASAGTIHRWTAHSLPSDYQSSSSTHGGSLAEAFALAGSLGYDLSRVLVYGIELESAAPGDVLSVAVRTAGEELVRLLEAASVNMPV